MPKSKNIRQIVLIFNNEDYESIYKRMQVISNELCIKKDNALTFLKILEFYEENRYSKKEKDKFK